MTVGSGGNYLSNEIFYRVSKIRKEKNPTLPSGHFHVSQIQTSGYDFDNDDTSELLQKVKKAIAEAKDKL